MNNRSYLVRPPQTEGIPFDRKQNDIPLFILRSLGSRYSHYIKSVVAWSEDEYAAAINFFAMAGKREMVEQIISNSSPAVVLSSLEDFDKRIILAMSENVWKSLSRNEKKMIVDAIELRRRERVKRRKYAQWQ